MVIKLNASLNRVHISRKCRTLIEVFNLFIFFANQLSCLIKHI
jgi:hypothetical protein